MISIGCQGALNERSIFYMTFFFMKNVHSKISLDFIRAQILLF